MAAERVPRASTEAVLADEDCAAELASALLLLLLESSTAVARNLRPPMLAAAAILLHEQRAACNEPAERSMDAIGDFMKFAMLVDGNAESNAMCTGIVQNAAISSRDRGNY